MSHILIVDDEFDVAQVIRGILEDEGHTVSVCNNGRQVLEQQLTDKMPIPNLILLDVVMPFVGGIEVLKRIRGEEAWTDVPVVLMHNTEPAVKKSEGKWDDLLQKPFNIASLLTVVQRFTGSHGSFRSV